MFATVAATALFAAAAEGIGFSIYIYFVTYFWKLTATQMGILITDAFFGSLIAFFIAPALSRRLGSKKQTAMWLLVVTVALTLAPLSLRLLGLFPGDGSPALIPTLYAIATVRGALGITCAILITAMIADVVEDSQVATGRRSEGVFFAAISFIQKSVSGVGAMLTGVILTVIHFPVGKPASMVPQGTVNSLAILYMVFIVTLYGLALFCLSFYRINRKTHQANLERIAEMEKAAEAANPPVTTS